MTGRKYGGALAALLAVGVVGGCGTVAERQDDVRDTAARFQAALHDGAYDRACALLAPDTEQELQQSAASPCPEALSQESLPAGGAVRHTDVYGNQARAVLASDTLFLSLFTGGWKVVAAGCETRPGRPYQCTIKGG
ncbi:hypothetical protein QFZ56_007251 [Streptomyces achromogenes]|uniref:Lipoprotein n=1 Tax=Streptomyces achromogenes TaxID=67255 RepID=A0ABU0QEW5_STRAH|nr:hypothetical protein [Streptomyces achromogenes]MDQ0688288.1 hypothetical protein [Streptomyces achromogenes]